MPLIIGLLALLTPRIIILLLWFFTAWFAGVFQTLLWPILGFIFLPTTLLWYSTVVNWFGGEWTIVPIAGLLVALVIDLSPASARRRTV